MKRPVGVFNAPPVYTLGLVDAFRATAYWVDVVSDPMSWTASHGREILMLVVNAPNDLDVVVDVCRRVPDAAVITVLDRITREGLAASLQAGATGSVALYAPPEEVVLALNAATTEKILVPTPLARSMVGTDAGRSDRTLLSEIEVTCLEALARGEKVSILAGRLGYSEREIYRRLRRLYTRMGVKGKTQALLLACRWGVIE